MLIQNIYGFVYVSPLVFSLIALCIRCTYLPYDEYTKKSLKCLNNAFIIMPNFQSFFNRFFTGKPVNSRFFTEFTGKFFFGKFGKSSSGGDSARWL